MKKFLLLLVLVLTCTITSNAQVLQFRSEAYSQRTITSYGWSGWSNWEKCNVSITINLNNDQVTVYSSRTQRYQIFEYSGAYMDGTTQCIDYRFYDQDGDIGTMTLAMKSSGQSEIYIRFANIQWSYIVRRL